MKIEDEIDGKFRNDFHKGFINLIYTANILSAEFNAILKDHNLTSQQYNVLRILRGFGSKPRSIDFLKKRMLDKNSDISRIIDKLFGKNLIDRVENQDDRRQKDITISADGLLLLEKLDNCEKKVDNLLSNLTSKEVCQLNSILDKIRD